MKVRIHHLSKKFCKLPHVFHHHQSVTLEFLDFYLTFSTTLL